MNLSSIIMDNTKKVPRPLNCFMTYRLEKQREILEQCPGANHRDISKITANWWKNMTTAEKEPYRRKAEKAKNEHERLYPDYKFTPKKKLVKTRVYKKRSESEYTSEDLKQKQQLAILYYHGIKSQSSTDLKDNNMVLTGEEEFKSYISTSIQHHNNLDAMHTNSLGVNEACNHNDNYIGRISPSTSTSNKSNYSTLQRSLVTTTAVHNSSARPPLFTIPSQSTTVSTSSPILSIHHTSSSLGHYSVLEKTGRKSCSDTIDFSNCLYGSTNLLQEPPYDPFDSPYNSNAGTFNNKKLNQYSHQSSSSSILPLFNHVNNHTQYGEDTTSIYHPDEKGNANSGISVDRHGKFNNLFHPGNSLKPTHSHLSIYYPSTHY